MDLLFMDLSWSDVQPSVVFVVFSSRQAPNVMLSVKIKDNLSMFTFPKNGDNNYTLMCQTSACKNGLDCDLLKEF